LAFIFQGAVEKGATAVETVAGSPILKREEALRKCREAEAPREHRGTLSGGAKPCKRTLPGQRPESRTGRERKFRRITFCADKRVSEEPPLGDLTFMKSEMLGQPNRELDGTEGGIVIKGAGWLICSTPTFGASELCTY